MTIEELIIQLKWIKKIYWNINLYNKKLNSLKDIWVERQHEEWDMAILNFYNFN